MLQLRVHIPQLKIPHAATKTQQSQINKIINIRGKKKKRRVPSDKRSRDK